MTFWDVVRAVGRFWFVAVYLLAGTVVAGVLVARHPGVYWGESRVQFYAPTASTSNRLEKSEAGLVSTAGLVQRLVSGEIQQSQSAGTVTLPGRGERHATSVVLPNSGGQWGVNFQGSVLEVEAVGSSADEVADRLDREIREIKETLHRVQEQAGIEPRNMMTASELPGRPTIVFRGTRTVRAVGTLTLLGLVATVTAVCALDRWVVSRRRRLGLPQPRKGRRLLSTPSPRKQAPREPELAGST